MTMTPYAHDVGAVHQCMDDGENCCVTLSAQGGYVGHRRVCAA
jgi:hypothetical protein